jgi:hypothetical protein
MPQGERSGEAWAPGASLPLGREQVYNHSMSRQPRAQRSESVGWMNRILGLLESKAKAPRPGTPPRWGELLPAAVHAVDAYRRWRDDPSGDPYLGACLEEAMRELERVVFGNSFGKPQG